MSFKIAHIILFSLLVAMVSPLHGQTKLPKHPSDHWTTLIQDGGVLRKDDYYMRIVDGIGCLTQFNFVDGLSVGPNLTFGKVMPDYGRIEIDEDIKWACSREALNAEIALRYVFPPQYCGFLEVFGGSTTKDFDRYPVMSQNQRSIAAGVFGWNHPKLYKQTTFGASLYGALGNDLQINALIAWERREQMENTCWRSAFGKTAKDNRPNIQTEPMEDFGVDKILRIDAQFEYMPGRKILVKDDLTSTMDSEKPVYSVRTTTGWNGGLRYLSFDFQVVGMMDGWMDNDKILYKAAAGFYAVRNKVLLMDMRHFDASNFAYQRGFHLGLFSLLDNYELSTSKCWIEGHAEWNNPLFYGQVHLVKVPDRPAHEELSGGISFERKFRLGCSIGFDDLCWDGIAVNFFINM